MKVKALVTIVAGKPDAVTSAAPGAVVDLDDAEAARLVRCGLAEPVAAPARRKAAPAGESDEADGA